MRFAGNTLPVDTAMRFAIEIRVEGGEICRAFAHLETSINARLNTLHPLIFEAYNLTCVRQ